MAWLLVDENNDGNNFTMMSFIFAQQPCSINGLNDIFLPYWGCLPTSGLSSVSRISRCRSDGLSTLSCVRQYDLFPLKWELLEQTASLKVKKSPQMQLHKWNSIHGHLAKFLFRQTTVVLSWKTSHKSRIESLFLQPEVHFCKNLALDCYSASQSKQTEYKPLCRFLPNNSRIRQTSLKVSIPRQLIWFDLTGQAATIGMNTAALLLPVIQMADSKQPRNLNPLQNSSWQDLWFFPAL